MGKPYDTRLIMMVAQMPFETQDLNQFCKLLPIHYVDGTSAVAVDFPNDGEIWWMLNARTAPLATPGRLLVGKIEDAVRYDESDTAASKYQSKYQAQRDSVRDLDMKDGLAIVDVASAAIESIEELVSSAFRIELPSHPTSQVMVRWRDSLYGPFKTAVVHATSSEPHGRFSFAPLSTDMSVYQISRELFDDAVKGERVKITREVSPNTQRRSDSYRRNVIEHELVLFSGYERALGKPHKKLVLESLERKLQRYAKQCLSRSKRQEFRALLDEMSLSGREIEEADTLIETVKRASATIQSHDTALDAVARAMLQCGLLGEDRIRKAEQTFGDKYVQEQAAQLQAKVQETLRSVGAELRQAQDNLKDVQSRILKEESVRRERHDRELARERDKAVNEIAADRAALDKQREALQLQQSALQKNLEKVTRELRDAGEDVVNRFLTIAPLIGSAGLTTRTVLPSNISMPTEDAAVHAEFELPQYVLRTSSTEAMSLSEEAFFERFLSEVESRGFVYRTLDLQRFHLSVKCGEMTVLGGSSGTGKSSLPMLYGQSLLGEEDSRPGCLMINVNPSWMDARDLLGHVNTLDGMFYPAETELFPRLVCAHEEYKIKKDASGLHLVCLDEMNLSQVEHYFSDVMMVLERDADARAIQCFASETVRKSCRFYPYARLPLPPGVKFVGTVNFDETTRLLSDRFLDRINLIQLVPGTLPNLSKTDGAAPTSGTGRMVTLSDLQGWLVDAALPADLGSLLDEMRSILGQLGCPLSPRAYRGICRFVASATKIMPASIAFDIQIAQRVIPKVRGLVTAAQLSSLDKLLRLMESAGACSFDESLSLLEAVRASAGARAWDLEE